MTTLTHRLNMLLEHTPDATADQAMARAVLASAFPPLPDADDPMEDAAHFVLAVLAAGATREQAAAIAARVTEAEEKRSH